MKTLKVAVDDGHGLGSRVRGQVDPGAVGNGKTEAAVVMLIGNELRAELRRRGHATMKPVGIYYTRDQQADAWGADLLVSLHLNAGGGHGTETYTHPGASAQSKKLAAAVQYRVLDALGVTDRGVKSHGYAVIAGKCPAILCEVAFIDSASDMRRLVAFGMYRKVAVAIADGIEAAFGVVRVSPTKPKPLVKPEPCEQTLILVSSVDKQSVIAAMRGLGQHVIQLAAEDGALLRVHHASRLTAKVEAEVERCGGTVRDVLPARWHDTTAREVNPSSGKSIGRVW